MSNIRFTAQKLVGTGKKGILVPDSDGCYTMPIGGLNVYNSVGQYYIATKEALALFEKSSVFMRRIESGNLKMETGHPKKLPGMSNDDYFTRVMSIEETNVCGQVVELWLDMDWGKKYPEYNNPKLIAIMARVRPCGPKGAALRAAFESGVENVNFSIRSLTRDYSERGQTYRILGQIMSFDWVTEPGLSLANKWASPALESFMERAVSLRHIQHILDVPEMVGMESAHALAQEALQLFVPREKKIITPLYKDW